MKASERTLQQLLHSSDQYVIPAFQRYYTWGVGNWKQLLNDLADLLDPASAGRRHFMGSLVTVADSHQPGSAPVYQVIDGQQRLTTLSLLLCALRDVARAHGWEELAAEVEENYLIHRHKKTRERYKVYPRLRDRGAYLGRIDGRDAAEGGQIEAAYRYFVAQLQHEAPTEAGLRSWFLAVVTRLDFVAITLGAENPYKIFRSLNSTGVDLSEADLIRNHVFMSLSVDEQDAFDDDVWRALEERFFRDGKLAGADFEAFLRDALMRTGTYVGRDETFAAFEARYPYGQFDPGAVVRQLERLARTYDVVRGVTAHADRDVEEALRAIRELNVTTTYPLLLALLERVETNQLARADLLLVLRAIASFVLRRFVCGASSRGYSTWFVAACRDLSDPARSVVAFLVAHGWPADDAFRPRLVRMNLYQSRYDRAVLGALERSLQSRSEPVLLDGCTIEHVMPQTIDETSEDGRAWIAALGDGWPATHAEWLHTLGNLTLVGADYNSGMSNRAFPLKQPVLTTSKVYLNQAFKRHVVWTTDSIAARGDEMADHAVRIWPPPPAA